MNKFRNGVVAVLVMVSLSGMMVGCNMSAGSPDEDTKSSNAPSTSTPSGPGIGFTYTGKPGIDIGGGFIIPLDGSSPGFGIGY